MNPDSTWPDSDLEYVKSCPMCGSSHRSTLYEDLEDWAFRAAPGKWTIVACTDCSSLYLDPRPNLLTIGRAYQKYYTHAAHSNSLPSSRSSVVVRIKAAMKRGYYRHRFGHPATLLQVVASLPLLLFRKRRLHAELSVRHLGRPMSESKRVLDVGCGSGDFLIHAARAGYAVVGLDPDPKALEAGAKVGIKIMQGGLPVTDFPDDHFEHITLSHVFEHLHDPVDSLAELIRILQPGGRLWMAMPNRGAQGLELFGKYWRGLEAPRHLVLPSNSALRQALLKCGLEDVTFHDHPPCGAFFVYSSLAQRAGLDPYDRAVLSRLRSEERDRLSNDIDAQAAKNKMRNEIMIVTAFKPH